MRVKFVDISSLLIETWLKDRDQNKARILTTLPKDARLVSAETLTDYSWYWDATPKSPSLVRFWFESNEWPEVEGHVDGLSEETRFYLLAKAEQLGCDYCGNYP